MRVQDHCASQRKCDDPRILGTELAVGHVRGVDDAPEGVDNILGCLRVKLSLVAVTALTRRYPVRPRPGALLLCGHPRAVVSLDGPHEAPEPALLHTPTCTPPGTAQCRCTSAASVATGDVRDAERVYRHARDRRTRGTSLSVMLRVSNPETVTAAAGDRTPRRDRPLPRPSPHFFPMRAGDQAPRCGARDRREAGRPRSPTRDAHGHGSRTCASCRCGADDGRESCAGAREAALCGA